jgi:hypothetical protein
MREIYSVRSFNEVTNKHFNLEPICDVMILTNLMMNKAHSKF